MNVSSVISRIAGVIESRRGMTEPVRHWRPEPFSAPSAGEAAVAASEEVSEVDLPVAAAPAEGGDHIENND